MYTFSKVMMKSIHGKYWKSKGVAHMHKTRWMQKRPEGEPSGRLVIRCRGLTARLPASHADVAGMLAATLSVLPSIRLDC